MVSYWLTPFSAGPPPVLPAERAALTKEEGDELRRLASTVHPRLLPSFKLAMLTGGEDGECAPGTGGSAFLLSQTEAITLGGPNRLSHCAAAFIERLLEPQEALRLSQDLAGHERFRVMRNWWKQGYQVVLLKEEL